jgi:hypothetical protein
MTESEAREFARNAHGCFEMSNPTIGEPPVYAAANGGEAFDTGTENGWQVRLNVTILFVKPAPVSI